MATGSGKPAVGSTSGANGKVEARRCVAVVGVGRSGTSATAGLLMSLGLTGPHPDDLLPASSSNESGHWESKKMISCNVQLLNGVGATHYGPPPVGTRWESVSKYTELRESALQWFATSYEGRPMMVKDPRLCATLPFWRDVLPVSMAAVFVLRDPLRVSRSRQARDDVPVTLGLAIWDRYIRSAAAVLNGLPTLVVEYDAMLADPRRATEEISAFLQGVGIDVPPEVTDAAAGHINPTLRHQESEEDQYQNFAQVQRQLFDALVDMTGVHDEWHPPEDLPPEPVWVEDVLRLRREYQNASRNLRKLRKSRANRIAAALGRFKP
jgi:hypothetical protein